MVNRLSVKNLAVVESAEVEFAPGLNVLTGETGAGKSVLMGALELVLGGRADSDVVRDGAKEARVEASFSVSAALARRIAEILDDAGLPACEGGELIIRRTVSASGSGRVWVNDAQTTVATLKKLGRILVDIHGPRANQLVLEERFQRETLDSYGKTPVEAYGRAWKALSDVRARIDALEEGGAAEEEADLLRYQVGEFEEAALDESDEDLAERHAAAAHAEEIAEAANEMTEALGGDSGAADTIARLGPKFAALARHMPEASAWAEEAEALTLRIEELSRGIADAASRIDADPGTLEQLDERLGVVNRLKRKYGKGTDGSIAALLGVLAAKKARLAEIEGRDEALAKLREEEKSLGAAARAAGAELTKKRKSAAEKLEKAVTKGLRELGFLQARFSVSIEGEDLSPSGCDKVEYMFEPNPGEAARPLAAIASSGETARVMLALKGVLAAHDSVDVLVFDEIDANIGGEVGRAVGERMKAVSRHHQVIAITHLPQSAVFADRHMVVSKSVSGGRTRTRIEEAKGDARISEIARMLGGEGLTSVVRAHAEELVKLAR